jgi:hypothetical protein
MLQYMYNIYNIQYIYIIYIIYNIYIQKNNIYIYTYGVYFAEHICIAKLRPLGRYCGEGKAPRVTSVSGAFVSQTAKACDSHKKDTCNIWTIFVDYVHNMSGF